MPLVYAIILNWNRAKDTICCLNSLATQTYPNLKLVVAENGSTDDSISLISTAFPDVVLLKNPANLGFAAGMNAGIKFALQANADFVFILNNDTVLAPETVSQLVAYTDQNTGLVAPIIYYDSDPQRIWSLGGRINPWTLEVTHYSRNIIDTGQLPACITQDFVPGCAMLLSRTALERVGLFDEDFFMYYEDSDLCLRLRAEGFNILSVANAPMWHKVALSSGGGDSPNERYWMARSSLRFFAKHARWHQAPFIFIWRLASALKTTWRLLHGGKKAALKAYWKGLWHGVQEMKLSGHK